ncbi:MAG TPA: AAA family ATPase [Polyangia bacterium]|nr:AAA family ATPase [Polyangia bacterium]
MNARDRRWPPEWARDLTADDVDGASVYLAIEAGGWPVDLPPRRRRAFALLVLASIEARGEGATRLGLRPAADLEARLRRLAAAADDSAAASALAADLVNDLALAPLIGRPGDYRPFILDGDHLYQERDLRIELRLAGALAARLAAPPFEEVGWTEARAAAAPPARTLTPSQSAALEAALGRRLTVVTGGPGSGKTALIGGIAEAWMALGIPAEAIAIAAPTGKAANRIAEVLAARGSPLAPPSTLHRLLGSSAGHLDLRGGEFRYHENRPLPHAAVIVDEASMVGLPLLEQLTRALHPEARLVLLGDADQLPAIQAGSVFRDLGAYAIRLTESHRMDPTDAAGARVLEAARGVARGELADTVAPASRTINGLTFSGFETLDAGPDASPAAARRLLAAFVDHWYATHLRPPSHRDRRLPERVPVRDGALEPAAAIAVAAALERQRAIRLLTVTRVGPAGSDRINAALGQRALRDAGVPAGGDALATGTPVMMTENDYDRGLMNGDQGIVVWIARDGTSPAAVAVFARGDALVPFPLATLRGALTVAYAMTVHKAQGSELDRAALILPEIDLPLLSRELIYTAVTRARRSIVVVGSRALLAQAIARPLPRSSGLAERLAALGARSETPPQPRP